ncbi:hypothetical protein DFP73DRAFT_541217 [Morchella snyderi]|nr:hypothetical protein DFP73DRAFT_541217 [Morchella snyderi]
MDSSTSGGKIRSQSGGPPATREGRACRRSWGQKFTDSPTSRSKTTSHSGGPPVARERHGCIFVSYLLASVSSLSLLFSILSSYRVPVGFYFLMFLTIYLLRVSIFYVFAPLLHSSSLDISHKPWFRILYFTFIHSVLHHLLLHHTQDLYTYVRYEFI